MITGDALLRSSRGSERETIYTFDASCSMRIESQSQVLSCSDSCGGSRDDGVADAPLVVSPATSLPIATSIPTNLPIPTLPPPSATSYPTSVPPTSPPPTSTDLPTATPFPTPTEMPPAVCVAEGSFLDADGNPAVGLLIRIIENVNENQNSSDELPYGPTLSSTTTNANGEYRMEFLWPDLGPYWYQAVFIEVFAPDGELIWYANYGRQNFCPHTYREVGTFGGYRP